MAQLRRPGRLRGQAAAVALVAVVGSLVACSSGTAGDAVATTVTTADPLAQPVVDACGNDLSALRSSVVGIDPATGAVRWRTAVPLAEAYLLHDESGDPRLSLVLRSVEAVVDASSGEVVGYPDAGVHEVLVGPPGPASADGVSTLLVDGEPQPSTIEVGGLAITTAAGSTGQATVGVTATDVSSAAPVWRVEVGAADAVGALSAPVLFGTTVVVVAAPPRPACG